MADPGEVNWDGRNDAYDAPMSTSEGLKIQQALYGPIAGRASLRRVKPPLPQIRANPKRHGYSTQTLGIQDILEVTRDYEPRVDWSGGIGSYSGADRNTLGTM